MRKTPTLLKLIAAGMALLFAGAGIAADEILRLQPITGPAYALVGPLGNRSPDNLGNNATFGFVVTDGGVVLIDPGGSYQGAAAIEAHIRQITDKPVKVVVNTGGQDHRWLGNGYFKSKGATIYASKPAVNDQQARFSMQYQALQALIGEDRLAGTEAVHADVTFTDRHSFRVGGIDFELIPGPAHTPGDTIVWIPALGIAFTGDLVYTERLLGVINVSSLNDWITSFEGLEALKPNHVVPGHGHATTLARAQTDTRDYLLNLQARIRSLIAENKGDRAAVEVDQSRWAHLANFDQLAKRNALAAFIQLEFE